MGDINDFLAISIVGGMLSIAFELIKKWLPDSSDYKKLAILTLSVGVGTGYWALRQTPYLETVIGVLAAASTVYAFLLKKEDEFIR